MSEFWRNRLYAGSEGQAMVEFVVALVALLSVFAGIFAAAGILSADTDTMTEATSDAVSASMSSGIASSFTPVSDWTDGPDGLTGTKDDCMETGSFSGIRGEVAGHTAPSGDWSAFDGVDGAGVGYSDLRDFHDGASSSVFGFVRGTSSDTVDMLPAARAFLGLPESVHVENEAWMPVCGGLY